MLHQFHKDFAKHLRKFNDVIKYVTTLFILMPFWYVASYYHYDYNINSYACTCINHTRT